MDKNHDQKLTTTEAGEILGVSSRTVSRWCREQRIPHTRPGGEYRILRSDVNALDAVVQPVRQSRPYRRDPHRKAEEASQFVQKISAGTTPKDKEVPPKSILTARERIEMEYIERLRNARHSDEGEMIKFSYRRKLAELEKKQKEAEATLIVKSKEAERAEDRRKHPWKYKNPPGF